MRAERIAQRQHGVIGGWQALGTGLTRRQIRLRVAQGRWDRLPGDVYGVVGAPDTWHRSVMAAVLAGGSGAATSHATAARLLGLEGVPFEAIEIVTIRERRRPASGSVERRAGAPGASRRSCVPDGRATTRVTPCSG